MTRTTAVTRLARVHDDTPGACWQYARATRRRTVIAHVSVGRPLWWLPNVGRRRYAGITEWRAGWLLVAIQVAHRPAPQTTTADRPPPDRST